MTKWKVIGIAGMIVLLLAAWNVGWASELWVAKGPAGSYIDTLFCDPTDPNKVYAGTNGGVFKTADLGSTWNYSGLKSRWVEALGAQPGCGGLIAGAEREVHISTDGGGTWNLAFNNIPDDIRAIAASPAPACVGYIGTKNGVYTSNDDFGLEGVEVSALAVDSAGNVYAASEEGGVFRSMDEGLSWEPVLEDEAVFAMIIDTNNYIFASAMGSGVLLSMDGGQSWEYRNNGLPEVEGAPGIYMVLSLAKGGDGTLYAGAMTSAFPLAGAVYKSTDNGETWAPTNSAFGSTPESMCVTPANVLFVGTARGIFRTEDSGGTWADQTARISAVRITNTFTRIANGTLFVATDGQGALKSVNGGETWTAAGTGSPQEATDIIADPGGNLFISGFGGVYKSWDQGTTWMPSSDGLPQEQIGAAAIPAFVESLGMDGNGNLYAGLEEGTVYASADQGQTWGGTSELPFSGDPVAVSALLGAPGTTVYAATMGNGVFKSTDGGLTWEEKNTGLPENAYIAYKSLYLDSNTGNIYLSLLSGGLYRTADGGETWESFPVAETECGNSVAVDAGNRLYAVACNSAVYVSEDNGATWQGLNDGLNPFAGVEGIHVTGITALGNTLLLATRSSGVMKLRTQNVVGDFNGDGNPDLIWRNTTTGRTTIWYMNGATWNGGFADLLPTVSGQNWSIVGVADFNGDSNPDIVWRDSDTGRTTIWYMDGPVWNGGYADVLPTLSEAAWSIVGVADFNGDNNPDLLWRNSQTGRTTIWYMNGPTWNGGFADVEPTLNDQDWSIVGIADFNGDSNPDLLWRNSANGTTVIWYMTGPVWNGGYAEVLPTLNDPNWAIAAVRDFNGDGSPDLLWRNTSQTPGDPNAYRTTVWYMDGPVWNGNWGDLLPVVSSSEWIIVGK
jgi:photosystem II stability/assembly factor-like uncharacterized protein